MSLFVLELPLIQRFPQATSSTVLIGGAPSQTNSPSQGSVFFYQDGACASPLTDTPTPLLLGECQNVPTPSGILAVSIASLPNCTQYGTPIFVVSNQTRLQELDGRYGRRHRRARQVPGLFDGRGHWDHRVHLLRKLHCTCDALDHHYCHDLQQFRRIYCARPDLRSSNSR